MDTAFVENPDRLELAGRVREELSDLMEIDRYSWDDRGTLTLRGQLSGQADALYRAIRTRMERLGFTPFLRHDAAGDELVAMPGVIERRPPRIGLPIALFLATIVSVMLTGALTRASTYSATHAGSSPGCRSLQRCWESCSRTRWATMWLGGYAMRRLACRTSFRCRRGLV